MILHCTSNSRFRFTPGQSYVGTEGGLTWSRYYVDVRDDAGQLQRFSRQPRASVGNEHEISELSQAFDWEEIGPPEFVYVWQEMQRGGYTRGLVIANRFGKHNAKKWVLALREIVSTDVRQFVRMSDFNLLRATGLPPGIYVTHLRDGFIRCDGSVFPVTVETFDFVFLAH